MLCYICKPRIHGETSLFNQKSNQNIEVHISGINSQKQELENIRREKDTFLSNYNNLQSQMQIIRANMQGDHETDNRVTNLDARIINQNGMYEKLTSALENIEKCADDKINAILPSILESINQSS